MNHNIFNKKDGGAKKSNDCYVLSNKDFLPPPDNRVIYRGFEIEEDFYNYFDYFYNEYLKNEDINEF